MDQSEFDKRFNEIISGGETPRFSETALKIQLAAADVDLHTCIVSKDAAEIASKFTQSGPERDLLDIELENTEKELERIVSVIAERYELSEAEAYRAVGICHDNYILKYSNLNNPS